MNNLFIRVKRWYKRSFFGRKYRDRINSEYKNRRLSGLIRVTLKDLPDIEFHKTMLDILERTDV